jgi:hypothetical protein
LIKLDDNRYDALGSNGTCPSQHLYDVKDKAATNHPIFGGIVAVNIDFIF